MPARPSQLPSATASAIRCCASALRRHLAELPPVRLVRHIIRRPEYGVLYLGTAFWIAAGTIGIGRPLFDVLLAHV